MRNKLDERQLYLRGNAFRNGFTLMILLLFVDAFLKSSGITLVEGMWSNILIIIIPSAFCIVQMITNDTFDLDDKSTIFFLKLLGVLGVILFIWGIIGYFVQGDSLMVNHSLSEKGAFLVMDIGWMSIGIAYLIKARKSKKLDEY